MAYNPEGLLLKSQDFVLTIYSGLPGSVLDIPSVTALEERGFSMSQQVSPISRVLVTGEILCPGPLFSARVLSGLNLCWSCAYHHCCIWEKLFLGVIYHFFFFLAFTVFLVPCALRDGFDKDIWFWAECSEVPHSLHVVQLWSLC